MQNWRMRIGHLLVSDFRSVDLHIHMPMSCIILILNTVLQEILKILLKDIAHYELSITQAINTICLPVTV